MGTPSPIRGAPGTPRGPDPGDEGPAGLPAVATAPAGPVPRAGRTLAMDSLCTSPDSVSWSYSPSTTASVVLGKADAEPQGHPAHPRPPPPPHGHPAPT